MLTRVQAIFINQQAVQKSLSVYAGCGSVVFSIPGFVLRLKLGAVLDPYIKSHYNLSQFTTFAIVSSMADALNVIFRTPAEHYRQQYQTGSYGNIKKFTHDYLGHLGPLGFWRGASVFLLRDITFNILRFGTLEKTQEIVNSRVKRYDYEEDFNKLTSQGQKTRLMQQFRVYTWCNIFATIPAAILTTPFDVIKTRIMTCPPSHKQPIWEMTRELIKEEGFSSLFRGAGLRAFYVSTLISIFTSLDYYLNVPINEAKKAHEAFSSQEDLFK